MRKIRLAALGAGVITFIAGTGAASAAPASAAPHGPAKWTVALKTAASANFPYFSAGAALSATSAWAFEGADAGVKPVAYRLNGTQWQKAPFPGVKGVFVVSASIISSTDAWAFTQGQKPTVLRYDGHWTVIKTFSKPVTSGLAISSTDAWVFGTPFAPELGNMHYDGRTWTKTGGPALEGASALSASSIWAYGLNEVAHWNGRAWRATSVKSLLPAAGGACSPGFLSGIHAISAANVYAIGAGGCPDGQGPFVLLHYNGSKWSLLNIGTPIAADPLAIIGDGSDGVWITALTGAPPVGFIEHYANGKLTSAALPASHMSLIGGGAIGAHTTTAFIFGSINNAIPPTKSSAAILRYGS